MLRVNNLLPLNGIIFNILHIILLCMLLTTTTLFKRNLLICLCQTQFTADKPTMARPRWNWVWPGPGSLWLNLVDQCRCSWFDSMLQPSTQAHSIMHHAHTHCLLANHWLNRIDPDWSTGSWSSSGTWSEMYLFLGVCLTETGWQPLATILILLARISPVPSSVFLLFEHVH